MVNRYCFLLNHSRYSTIRATIEVHKEEYDKTNCIFNLLIVYLKFVPVPYDPISDIFAVVYQPEKSIDDYSSIDAQTRMLLIVLG